MALPFVHAALDVVCAADFEEDGVFVVGGCGGGSGGGGIGLEDVAGSTTTVLWPRGVAGWCEEG